ncbi:inositol 1,4,5-triphosphate receptor associated 2 isoform X2 [Chiloscyllium plagiosum]|uniref:inositol 1,4,5-triphosphate receptor associated 2 isoform X2 n=1 Tax=Chiloscyllium plagiosum TaxID=36176 RepID=UPI001CB7C290|nr:inositol 1,4,5-triphosphate receptor associated 2 isoform X2 [Chiloscyllium plagiosum]
MLKLLEDISVRYFHSSSNRTMCSKRHNPVESICKKLQTIQKRDQMSNPVLQIPKFRSRNFESPQVSLKKNMEVILRNRTAEHHTVEQEVNIAVANCTPSPKISTGQPGKPPTVSSTYTVVSSIGGMLSKPLHRCGAQSCSTPVSGCVRNITSLSQPYSAIVNIEHRIVTSDDGSVTCSPVNSSNFNFYTRLHRTQSPVAKKLSLDETSVNEPVVVNRMENAEEMSLICEEDLLDTIFYACDTKHRGKVPVSMIVDYLRHTTSRSSEDSGLEDLCNMLDPDNKDVSIDLNTYRAVMKEWIEDCRRKSFHEETQEVVNVNEDVVQHRNGVVSGIKLSDATDGTVGSLEALGGEISKGDLETSDLISCIADLQYNHQKLQDQNLKLRLVVEATEESNNRLMEENEELLTQVKSAQQTVLIEKSLKEDLEELRTQISTLQESNERLILQNKQEVKDNQYLIQKIASLQEENLRITIDIEALHDRIAVLSSDKTELQMQLTDLDNLVHDKDAALLERDNHIEELKDSIVEYSLVVEALRTEKTKLENQLLMQQELSSECIKLTGMPQDGHDLAKGPSSLQSELLNAQCALEVDSSEWSRVSEHPFDEALDKEVVMLIQSLGTEAAAVQFKMITTQMTKELSGEIEMLVTWLKQIGELKINSEDLNEAKLEHLRNNLQERRRLWLRNICDLEEQKLAVDREYVRLASNFRRSRTEQLHLRKRDAARLQELEAQKQLTETAATALKLQLNQVSQQLEDLQNEVFDKNAALASVRNGTEVLQHELEEAVTGRQRIQSINQALSDAINTLEQKLNQQQTTIQSLSAKLFQQELCGLQTQTGRCYKGLRLHIPQSLQGSQAPLRLLPCSQPWMLLNSVTPYSHSPLLDALLLEDFYPKHHFQNSLHIHHNIEQQNSMASADELINIQSRCQLQTVLQTEGEVSVTEVSGEYLNKAGAGKKVNSHDLLQPSEEPDLTCTGPVEISIMSGSSASSTSIRRSDSGLQLQEIVKTLDAVNENNVDMHGKIKDTTADGPGPHDGSQLTLKHQLSKTDELGSRSKVKINLEATRGSVAVEELSPSELQAVHPSPHRDVQANYQSSGYKIQDLLNLRRISNTEQDVEAEFLRFSLAFKCDIFTLEKRLRLEERSRDLAEINLKKEIEKCHQTLQIVKPLCEEQQLLETFEKLERSLAMLSQTISRMASKAEMLGAIHQETRVSKAVGVMIQYVENLKRMYAKEHTELEEMKQLLQNGKASSSFREIQDELQNKKFLSTQTLGKNAPRRVSIATIPRHTAGVQWDTLKLKEVDEGRRKSEGDQDKLRNKLTRKLSSWKILGGKAKDPCTVRPTLHRFISTYTWGGKDNQLVNKGNAPALDAQDEEEKEEEVEDETILTEPEKKSANAESCVVYRGISRHLLELWNTFSKGDRLPWLPIILFISLSILGSFLIGWTFHTSVDAASVVSGDSWKAWKAIQQFLWPYTELRHNGQPPV